MIYVGAIAIAYALASLLWAPGGQPLALAELASLCVAFALGRMLYVQKTIWTVLVWVVSAATIAYVIFPIINPKIVVQSIFKLLN